MTPVVRRNQDRFIRQLDDHEIDRVIDLAVRPVRLNLRQRRDHVDRRDIVGNSIRQQVGRPRFAVPFARLVFAVRQEDAGCSVLIGVDEDEINRLVFGMAVPEAVLPHRQTQSASHPFAVGRQQPRFVEELVGQIVMRKIRRLSAVMAVIAAQDEIRAIEAVLRVEFRQHLPDQHVGLGDDFAGRAELAPAVVVVTDGIRFRQPDDRDGALSLEEKMLGVIDVGLIHVPPRIVVLEVRHILRQAPRPRDRRKFGHHGQAPVDQSSPLCRRCS